MTDIQRAQAAIDRVLREHREREEYMERRRAEYRSERESIEQLDRIALGHRIRADQESAARRARNEAHPATLLECLAYDAMAAHASGKTDEEVTQHLATIYAKPVAGSGVADDSGLAAAPTDVSQRSEGSISRRYP